MLSPDVTLWSDNLAQAFSTVAQVDAFAYASMNTLIGKLSPDPNWLGPMRKEMDLLSAAGAQWQQDKPTIMAPLLAAFPNYGTLFSGVAQSLPQAKMNSAALLDLLNQLSVSLGNAREAANTAERLFTLRINNLNNIQTVFDSSLTTAWAALADEEQQMQALAAEVTTLQDKVNQLQESITSAELSSGKSYVQSSVSISYTLVSAAGAEIPYLAIAGLVFTVGKMAYDLIVTDQEINDTLNRIADLRVKASQEAQAAAMSKALIQLIVQFDKSLLAVQRQLPGFSAMWNAEQQKINAAMSAIRSGANPSLMMDIASMPAAEASWKTLSDLAAKLPLAVQPGTPVTLSTSPVSQEAIAV